MNRRICQMALGAMLAIPLSGVLASPALAETVVMGSTLTNDFDGGISTGPTVSVQLGYAPATSPNPVVSPVNGVITGWKVKSADDGALYTLKVMRPNGTVSLQTATNSNFTAIASVQAPSAVPAGTGATTPTGVVFDYPASLPISQGDYIGLLTGGADDDVPQKTTNGVTANLIANNFAGQPADGAAANLLADEQHDLLLQATVKFCKVPNLQGKKLKAAKKALAAADCAAKVSKKKGAKKKQRGKVIKQKQKAGFTAPPGTQIPIVVGKK
jgi:PASTA domain